MPRESVSELFDPAQWREVEGFDLQDVTYHRSTDEGRTGGVVRVAFDRPEVRNAFRPGTVDELHRVLDHARSSPDVGCVLLTGNGPSPKDGGWAFCSGGDQRIRGRSGYQYAAGETVDTVDPARVGAEGGRFVRAIGVEDSGDGLGEGALDAGLVGHGEAPRGVQFRENSKWLASASRGPCARRWTG